MPNTLAHIGIQGLATKSIMKNADYKWILIGCVIPDIPWILQRILSFFFDLNPYDLRLYVTVQSSLFFCIILSFSIAGFSKQYWRTFLILSLNAFLHLLIDSLQTKWANGVHLFAPFDWRQLNFGLFWPENIITNILTIYGLIHFLIIFPNCFKSKFNLIIRPTTLILPIVFYIFLPFLFLSGPEDANNHFVKTLRLNSDRTGKYIEVDRGKHIISETKEYLKIFAGEAIEIERINSNLSPYISVQGIFINNNLIKITKYHTHNVGLRDIASYVGLLLVFLYLACSTLRQTMNDFKKRK